MIRPSVLLLVLFLLTASPAAALAGGLDVGALRTGIALRAGLGDDPGRVVIEKAVPVGGKEPAAFYAVRASVRPPKGEVAPYAVRPMLVDAAGAYLVGGLADVATGAPAAEQALREALRYDLPEDFGRTIWKGEPGGKTVVLVSDPFCPYCRQLFKYLGAKRSRITRLRLVHRPAGLAASLASCMIMDYALDNARARKIDPWQVASFIYGGVPETMAKHPQGPLLVLEEIMKKFPALNDLGTPEQAVDKLNAAYSAAMQATVESTYPYGITTVPCAFVDGVPLQGFNKDLLNLLLDN